MIHFQTLGTPQVLRPDGAKLSLRRQQLALLALLASEGDRGLTRDRVCGYLWPESPSETARHSLEQLLYSLRRQLGQDLFEGGPDPVCLNLRAIGSDVADFDRLVAAGRPAGAVDLYHGPFLTGFHLPDSAEFEEWAAAVRLRVESIYTRLLEELAISAGQRGAHSEAVARWQLLAARDPLSTRVALALCEAMARSGDAASSLRHADNHARLIRAELDIDPDPALGRLVVQIRRGEIGAEPRPTTAPAPVGDGSAPTEPSARPPLSTSRRSFLPGVLLLAGVAVAFLVWWLGGRVGGPSAPGPRFAVLPFRTIASATPGDSAALAWLEDGIADLLTTRMAGLAGDNGVDFYAARSAWRRAQQARDPVTEALRITDAEAGLTGRIVPMGKQFQVVVEFYQGAPPKLQNSFTVQGTADNLMTLVDEIANRVAGLRSRIDPQRLGLLASASTPALRAYLAGRRAYGAGDVDSALARYELALTLDSTFAVAALELAAATGWVSSKFIPPQVGTRLLVGYAPGPGGLARPEYLGEWHRAIKLARGQRARLPARDQTLLTALAGRRYPQPTPLRERLEDWELAYSASPDRPDVLYAHGMVLLYVAPAFGVPEALPRAIAQFRRALELDPGFRRARLGLIEALALAGNLAGMRHEAEEFLRTGGTTESADYVRWHRAALMGDQPSHEAERAKMSEFSGNVLEAILWTSQMEGISPDDGDEASSQLIARAAGRTARRVAHYQQAVLDLNRGRPVAANEAIDFKRAFDPYAFVSLFQMLRFGLYWDGDGAAANSAAHTLAELVLRTTPDDTTAWADSSSYHRAVWFLGLWHLAREEDASAAARLGRLVVLDRASRREDDRAETTFLEGLLMARRGGSGTARAARLVDSLAKEGCCGVFANLLAAAALERADAPREALAALRRGRWSAAPENLSRYLEEEGRVALAIGDTTDAIAAWKHRLALSHRPEATRARADSLLRERVAALRTARGR